MYYICFRFSKRYTTFIWMFAFPNISIMYQLEYIRSMNAQFFFFWSEVLIKALKRGKNGGENAKN